MLGLKREIIKERDAARHVGKEQKTFRLETSLFFFHRVKQRVHSPRFTRLDQEKR